MSGLPDVRSTIQTPSGRILAALGAFAIVVAVGYVDYASGTELRVYPLYFVPVALAAGLTGRRGGLLVALGAIGSWAVSNHMAGLRFSSGWVWTFNAGAHSVSFLLVVLLVGSIQRHRLREHQLARLDPLTLLPNRRSLLESARVELARQRRRVPPAPLTIAYIDLDGFKAVNDRLGHAVGDVLLSEVALALRGALRGADIAARLGGDEFAVLASETDLAGARALLERVRRDIGRAMAARSWPVTCSIGGVTFREPPNGAEELLARADALMYEVKRGGKNAVRVEPAGERA